ncbi:MAG TPA: MarR family transcriptional regulator [Armatimonadota bacterium]|jgi:DNA-binding MarR family transcriptional regulator
MNQPICCTLDEQAGRLEQVLPEIARRLFTLTPEHPASELPVGQIRVCSILQNGPLTLSAVGEILSISSSAMSQIADRLERAGYVARTMEADDRRVRFLGLTPLGEEMMAVRREHRKHRACLALSRLDCKQREALLKSLGILAEAALAVQEAQKDDCGSPQSSK